MKIATYALLYLLLCLGIVYTVDKVIDSTVDHLGIIQEYETGKREATKWYGKF